MENKNDHQLQCVCIVNDPDSGGKAYAFTIPPPLLDKVVPSVDLLAETFH